MLHRLVEKHPFQESLHQFWILPCVPFQPHQALLSSRPIFLAAWNCTLFPIRRLLRTNVLRRQNPQPTIMYLKAPLIFSEDATIAPEVTQISKPYTRILFSIFRL